MVVTLTACHTRPKEAATACGWCAGTREDAIGDAGHRRPDSLIHNALQRIVEVPNVRKEADQVVKVYASRAGSLIVLRLCVLCASPCRSVRSSGLFRLQFRSGPRSSASFMCWLHSPILTCRKRGCVSSIGSRATYCATQCSTSRVRH